MDLKTTVLGPGPALLLHVIREITRVNVDILKRDPSFSASQINEIITKIRCERPDFQTLLANGIVTQKDDRYTLDTSAIHKLTKDVSLDLYSLIRSSPESGSNEPRIYLGDNSRSLTEKSLRVVYGFDEKSAASIMSEHSGSIMQAHEIIALLSPKEKKVRKIKEQKQPAPPSSLEEVYKWAASRWIEVKDSRYELNDYLARAEEAFNYYASRDWYDTKGDPVLVWKNKIVTNFFSKITKAPFGFKPKYNVSDIASELSTAVETAFDAMTIFELKDAAISSNFAKQIEATNKIKELTAFSKTDFNGLLNNGELDPKITKGRLRQLLIRVEDEAPEEIKQELIVALNNEIQQKSHTSK